VRADETLYNSCIGGAISEADYLGGLAATGLVDVQVEERLPYDSAQLESLLVSESHGELASGCCGSGQTDVAKVAESVVGNVWSARVTARKP